MSPSSGGISGVAPLPALPIIGSDNIDYGSSSRENFLHTRSISQAASTVYTTSSSAASPTVSHPHHTQTPAVMVSKFIQVRPKNSPAGNYFKQTKTYKI